MFRNISSMPFTTRPGAGLKYRYLPDIRSVPSRSAPHWDARGVRALAQKDAEGPGAREIIRNPRSLISRPLKGS